LNAHYRQHNIIPMVISHAYVDQYNLQRNKHRKIHHEYAERLSKSQKRPRKCARCSQEWRNLDPGAPRYKKCGQCNVTIYCGPEVRRPVFESENFIPMDKTFSRQNGKR
jgi:hypothetical protein